MSHLIKVNLWITHCLFFELDFYFDAGMACGYFVARKAMLAVDIIGLFNKCDIFCEITGQVYGLSERRILQF